MLKIENDEIRKAFNDAVLDDLDRYRQDGDNYGQLVELSLRWSIMESVVLISGMSDGGDWFDFLFLDADGKPYMNGAIMRRTKTDPWSAHS